VRRKPHLTLGKATSLACLVPWWASNKSRIRNRSVAISAVHASAQVRRSSGPRRGANPSQSAHGRLLPNFSARNRTVRTTPMSRNHWSDRLRPKGIRTCAASIVRRQCGDTAPGVCRPTAFAFVARKSRAHRRGTSTQGMASLIVRSSPDLLSRPSRAMDSIIGQFCRKNVVAS
jgi:hypothetical protein